MHPQQKGKGKSVTFRPTRQHRARLERLARADQRPISFFIEKALEAYLPTLEKLYQKQLQNLKEEKEGNGDEPAPIRAR